MDNADTNRTQEEFGPFEQVGPKDLIEAVQENRRELARQHDTIEQLRKQLARGTGDVKEQAEKAVAEVKEKAVPLPKQVEKLLRGAILTTDDLAKSTGRTRDEVLAAIKAQRPKIHNLGSPDRGRWSWRLGNEASPQELRALVERLISFAPMEFRDLTAATGARDGLVQGHLIELRKTRAVVDLGTPGRARWFIMPEGARDAHLRGRRG